MKLRIGMIGCGIVSDSHIQAYKHLEDRAAVVAVADTRSERANAAAGKLGNPRRHGDYREILQAPDVDAVDICLPHHLHREVAIAAMEAGKHVLCEKPIARSLEEADAMIAAAERAGRVLMVAENYRFLPEVVEAKRLLAEGVIGEVVLIQSLFAGFLDGPYLETEWRFTAGEAGGGALLDSGIHYVDMLLALMGRPISVSCFTRRVRGLFPAEDTAVVTAEFAGGVLGELVVGWSMRHDEPLLFRVYGTGGTLTARHGSLTVLSERIPGRPAVYWNEPTGGFVEEISHFVECVSSGKQPLVGGPEARADLEFVLAAYESARRGERVRIPL